MKPQTLHLLVPADSSAPIKAILAERGSLGMDFTQVTPGRMSAGLPAHPVHTWVRERATDENPRAVRLLRLLGIPVPETLAGEVWLNTTALVDEALEARAQRMMAAEALAMGKVDIETTKILQALLVTVPA